MTSSSSTAKTPTNASAAELQRRKDPDPPSSSSEPAAPQSPAAADDDDAMRFEERRLATFRAWPTDAKVEARKIAKAGFFHTGERSEAKCRWCACVIATWDYGDQVMARHRAANPACPFVLNASDNVPLAAAGVAADAADAVRPAAADDGGGAAAANRDVADGSPIAGRRIARGPLFAHGGSPGSQPMDADDAAAVAVGVVSAASAVDPAPVYRRSTSSPTVPTAAAGAARPAATPAANAEAAAQELKSELARLRTFLAWPLPFIRPQDLARTGFVYTGRADCVRCVFCGEYVGDWDPTDDPATEHRNLFPHCPLVRGLDVGNVPAGAAQRAGDGAAPAHEDRSSSPPNRPSSNSSASSRDFASPMQLAPGGPAFAALRSAAAAGPPSLPAMMGSDAGVDEAGIRRRDVHAGPERLVLKKGSGGASDESIGIIRHSGPGHPKYSTPESRLRTFKDWPPALAQRPQQLAEAGFFYIGLSDQVKCFYCDGGLRNWQPEDDPWTEHARWFSKCGFVRLVKGDEFIAKSIVAHPPEPGPELPAAFAAAPQRTVKDEDIQQLMSSPIVHAALAMGIDASRIKMALKHKLSLTGSGFSSADELVEAAFGVQREQEDRVTVENSPSTSAFQRAGGVASAAGRHDRRLCSDAGYSTAGSGHDLSPPIRPYGGAGAAATDDQRADERTATTPVMPADDSLLGESSSQTTDDESQAARNPAAAAQCPAASASPAAAAEPPLDATMDTSEPGGTAAAAEQQLELENRRLKEQRTCKICMDAEIGVVFLPCGHLICCVNCAPVLADCPLCRQPIHGTVKTYMS